jgi:indole-3-glycerol phosphate synthase
MQVTLDQILSSTRLGLEQLRARRTGLATAAAEAPVPVSFARALRRERVAVIAEVKRRSPSAGSLREDLDPAERAALYARHGAAAVSVLTDAPYFGGSIDDLGRAARAIRQKRGLAVPLLRKDFILDELQITEARAAGASAVLLIVRALDEERLCTLLAAAGEQGLDALVEVHTEPELDRALAAGAKVIGVNSRDLDTFRIDVEDAWQLLSRVPADRIAVAESGMASRPEVERAAGAGADAVLIGSALSTAAHPAALLQSLQEVSRRAR